MARRGFWDSFLDLLFGESARPEADRPLLGAPMLANWLPYRSYDAKSGLFINTESMGFILELAPMMGADERSGEILTQFLSDAVPSGCEIQLIHWQSPSVGTRIADWVMPRVVAKGVYGRAAAHRARWLRRGAWMSISRDAPFFVRSTRLILSVGARLSGSIGADVLSSVRESLKGTCQALSIPAREMGPVELIAFLDDFLCPSVDNADRPEHYSELDPINVQCIRRDLETQVTPDRIVLRTERFRPTGENVDGAPVIGEVVPDAFDWRFFAVRHLPKQWAPWDVQKIIGDMVNDKLRFGCNVMTVMGLVFQDDEAVASRTGLKVMRTTSLADSRSAPSFPNSATSGSTSRARSARAASSPRSITGSARSRPWARATSTSGSSNRSTRRQAGTSSTSATCRSWGSWRPCRCRCRTV